MNGPQERTLANAATFGDPGSRAPRSPGPYDQPGLEDDGVTLGSLVDIGVRYRWLILASALLALALTSAYLLTRERTYTSSASFVPQKGRSQPSNVAGIAAQLGVNLPTTGDAVESPAFYAELLATNEVLGAVVDSVFEFTTDGRRLSANLEEWLRAKGPTPAARRVDAIERMRRRIGAVVRPRSGIVHLSVSAPHPELAAAISGQIIAELNRFNLERRRSQAVAEREFTERRLRQVTDELRESERALQRFLEGNRSYRSSPLLSLTHDRLTRDNAFKQELYSSMLQAHEQAKIEQVRDTPVITVVERPTVPVKPDSRRILASGFLALVFGALVGLVLGISRQALQGRRAVPR
jgi:uncharacterized protein involved in exopolysaccharide biosynthesis